ncbi:hypothetical protein HPB50_026092 [Hyalomma asiaticum]|uniref:Uncharacterized protein n=1 Tax=Hyalomma asiaticum TaxID=266040 RepID=A0ACB7T9A3_HYAAI|nr:hypothetical protein HPB50_026092 [Hyalomma asiaticum]
MARSEEGTIISVAAEDDCEGNVPTKVYKPSTWTSQPGTHLAQHKHEGQPTASVAREKLPQIGQLLQAQNAISASNSGIYDDDTGQPKYEQGRQPTTRLPRKPRRRSTELEVKGAHSRESCDVDVSLTKREPGRQPTATLPHQKVQSSERRSQAKSTAGGRNSDSYDVLEDETRTIRDNEIIDEVSTKGVRSEFVTAPVSGGRPQKKKSLDVPVTEEREPAYQSLWRRVLVAAHGGGVHESSTHQPTTAPGTVVESGLEADDVVEEQDYHEIRAHGLFYYVWLLCAVLFVLLAIPVAFLLLSRRRSDFAVALLRENNTASGPFQARERACIEDANSTTACNKYPSPSSTLVGGKWRFTSDKDSSGRYQPTVVHHKQITLVRPVICVLKLSTRKLWEHYKASGITMTYCAVLVWESLSLGTPQDHKMGRRNTLATSLLTFAQMVLRTKQFRTPGNGTLPIYVTIGGERSDSPAFSSMLQNSRWQESTVVSLLDFGSVLNAANKPTVSDRRTPAVSLARALVLQEFHNLGLLKR